MGSMRPLGPKSSLLSHSFPSFYACYLLKSIQTPQSTAVYIGSTPSPPRRIRQHNGELTQGARRTLSKRPWVMQMIVHGFPSRLAALQFEWAWQNPHKSRHLRDADGSTLFGTRASKILKKNIIIVRAMISKHPFNTWPLHVKLFTEEAVKLWKAAAAYDIYSLPPGFTFSVELEGVDGKSGHSGSGRKGPISVDDSEFTSELLAKNTAILRLESSLDCSICHKPVENYSKEPLKTALCPASDCLAVSHLDCLSQSFLNNQPDPTPMIPRGGNCNSCGNYTLWGDIVRGCYRRLPVDGQHPDVATDDMFLSDEDDASDDATPMRPKSGRAKSASPTKRLKSTTSRSRPNKDLQSSQGESFDFTNIVSSSESDNGRTAKKRTPGRPRKHAGTGSPTLLSPISFSKTPKSVLPRAKSPSKKGKGNEKAQSSPSRKAPVMTDSEDILPIKRKPGRPRNDQSPSDDILKTKRGRPRNNDTSPSLQVISPKKGNQGKATKNQTPSPSRNISRPDRKDVATTRRKPGSRPNTGNSPPSGDLFGPDSDVSPTKKKPGRPSAPSTPVASPSRPRIETSKRRGVSPPLKVLDSKGKGKARAVSSSSEGESFDFDNIVSSSEDFSPLKRKPGRPRKSLEPSSNKILSPVSPSNTKRQTSPRSVKVVTESKAKGKAEPMESKNDKPDSTDISFISHITPAKRKPGRPRKIMGQTPLEKRTAHIPEQVDRRQYFTEAKYPNLDHEIIDLEFSNPGQTKRVHSILPSKSRNLGLPRSPNISPGVNLELAMSALAISTSSNPHPPDLVHQSKDIKVIELSD